MIWLAWRQFRAQVIVAGGVLIVFAIVVLVTGLGLAHTYDTSGLPGCAARHNCGQALTVFSSEVRGSVYAAVLYGGVVLIYAAPALMGAFWGAPLVAREFEAGTFRLAWTQSVSRNRWLLSKVALAGLVAVIVAGLASLMLTWWSGPVYEAARFASAHSSLSVSRFTPLLFGVNGIAPAGYTALAFALGVTAGVLLRRTVPAMAVTLVGFAFVQIAWPAWVRPHLIAPVQSTVPLSASQIGGMITSRGGNQMTVFPQFSKPGSWVLSDLAVDSSGHPFAGPAPHACVDGSAGACDASLNALHLHQLVTYQPASRYWPLQGYEAAIFIIIATALTVFCMIRIRRRRLA